jgi:hypothetical protein
MHLFREWVDPLHKIPSPQLNLHLVQCTPPHLSTLECLLSKCVHHVLFFRWPIYCFVHHPCLAIVLTQQSYSITSIDLDLTSTWTDSYQLGHHHVVVGIQFFIMVFSPSLFSYLLRRRKPICKQGKFRKGFTFTEFDLLTLIAGCKIFKTVRSGALLQWNPYLRMKTWVVSIGGNEDWEIL